MTTDELLSVVEKVKDELHIEANAEEPFCGWENIRIETVLSKLDRILKDLKRTNSMIGVMDDLAKLAVVAVMGLASDRVSSPINIGPVLPEPREYLVSYGWDDYLEQADRIAEKLPFDIEDMICASDYINFVKITVEAMEETDEDREKRQTD